MPVPLPPGGEVSEDAPLLLPDTTAAAAAATTIVEDESVATDTTVRDWLKKAGMWVVLLQVERK